MKKMKVVASCVAGENLVVGKRILRSDAAKRREKKAKEGKRDGVDGKIATKELETEKKRCLGPGYSKKRELSKTQLTESSKEVVLRDHESNEVEIRTGESTFSSDVTEKTKAEGMHLKKSTQKDVIEAQNDSNIGSDVAKQRRKDGIGNKRAINEVGNSENVVIEDAPPGSNCNGASNEKCEDKSEQNISARNGLEKKKFGEVIKCSTKGFHVNEHGKCDGTDKEVNSVKTVSRTSQEIISAVRIRKKQAKITVENRWFPRSSAAKLMKIPNTSTSITSATGNQTCTEIEKKIVESKICMKKFKGGKTEVGKRRAMKSDAAKQNNEADKKRKKFMESELDGNTCKDAPAAGINRKKTKTDSATCKQDPSEQVQEGKKSLTGSREIHSLRTKEAISVKRQKNGPNHKRIKSTFTEGCRDEWCKQLDHLTLKEMKQNARNLVGFRKKGLNSTHRKKLMTKIIECGSTFPSTNKKIHVSEQSHIQMVTGKTCSFKEEIQPHPLSPLKESKRLDASRDCRDVMNGGESTTSHLTKEEIRMARVKLRDQIKCMLFNAGWKLDLRPRNGTNCLDAVYIAPNGSTYWSILKAYYAFQKQFIYEHDDEGMHRSQEPYEKSQKSSSLSFSPIPEEALSILKHPVKRRRTYKEIAEANRKLGISSTSQKVKKYMKDTSCQKKGGKHKGRGKRLTLVSSRAKGAVTSAGNKPRMGKYKRKQKGYALLVRSFNQETETNTDVYVPYAWKRTILSWMIDSGVVLENAAVKYMNQRRTKTLLKGKITRDGIHCNCCSKILTVSDFQTHAGSKQCNPYQNILVEEAGTSLSQCQEYAWKKQDESQRKGFHLIDTHGDDPNDDTCGICGDGGDLICCDGCPSTYHQCCLGTEMLPSGDWYCVNCSCGYCVLNSGIAVEENGGIDSPLLSCSQCQKKYHETCVPVEDAVSVNSRQSSISFCGQNCKKVFEKLQMLLGVKNFLNAGFSWTMVRRFDEDLPESVSSAYELAECNSKVAVALAVMDECFLPIIDKKSGINLIHNVVYNCGSNFSRLNYSGFYTFILERNDEVISVASLRIHGTRAAEMPFIGTRNMYRRQGMCRRLLNEIESVLRSLNIEKLIIPAISELMDAWTNVFGFKLLKISEKEEIRSINLLVFPGTNLLVKRLLDKDSIDGPSDKAEAEAASDIVLHTDVDQKPYDVIDQHKVRIKYLEPSFSVADSCKESHFSVSKYSGSHDEFQASEFKLLENSAQKDFSSQPEAVSLDEPEITAREQANAMQIFP